MKSHKNKRRKHTKGGGIVGSKSLRNKSKKNKNITNNRNNKNKISEMLKPRKTVLLFDIDDTLLFRRDIMGQLNLHMMQVAAGHAKETDDWRATIEKVFPRPDFFFDDGPTLVYIRPGVKELLLELSSHFGKENIHAFSASSDPTTILEKTGLRTYFNQVFDRSHTLYENRDGKSILLKNLQSVRDALKLEDQDNLIMIDDHPEWVLNKLPTDNVVGIKPFTPSYKLYDVVVMKYPGHNDPANKIIDNTLQELNLKKFLVI
jgi:hypothetical protein